MKNILLLILLSSVAFNCSSQAFLSKYSKLTKKNVPAFFADWKAYSDSISANSVIADSVLAGVIKCEYAVSGLDGSKSGSSTRYNVVPRYIKVERYYMSVDTTDEDMFLGYPNGSRGMDDNQYKVDSITPILPRNGLYLTSNIYNTLSRFVGGLRKGENIAKIKEKNVERLRKYITVDYGHWGGYWWFTSYPLIERICYTDNLIILKRRTSWCAGDVIWYVKRNGKFERRSEPVSDWIE